MQTAAELRQDNIVRVLRAAKKGEYLFMVSEFIDGESLTQVIARLGIAGQLEWQYAFRVCMQIARALELAESRQIVHRNVVPSNILIRRADKAALLNDLMLAKALEGVLAREVTGPGQLVGELADMAPERTHSSKDLARVASFQGITI